MIPQRCILGSSPPCERPQTGCPVGINEGKHCERRWPSCDIFFANDLVDNGKDMFSIWTGNVPKDDQAPGGGASPPLLYGDNTHSFQFFLHVIVSNAERVQVFRNI